MDTTTLLANKAVGWDAAAERSDADAARADEMAEWLGRGQTGMDEPKRREAEAHRAAAAAHRARADMARKGRLLIDPDDHAWSLANHELHTRCAAEGRCAYPAGTIRSAQ